MGWCLREDTAGMPRVRINLHEIDTIEDLEEQEDWEEQIGLRQPGARYTARLNSETRDRGRAERRELRFGGTETRDRKRDERRKQISRSARRFGQSRA